MHLTSRHSNSSQVNKGLLLSSPTDSYHHPLYYLETFVDQELFHGTCYRAANWLTIGQTTGRGKNDQTGRANRSLKDVLGYPLSHDFRDHLCGGPV